MRPRHRRTSRRQRRRSRRLDRRTLVGRHPVATGTAVVVLALTPVWISLAEALQNPGLGSTLGARLAEWTRDHGGSPAVNWAENLWYTHHAPPVGGRPAKGAIPPPPIGARVAGVGLPLPAPIKPIASPAVRGEGLWHPAGRSVAGVPAIYESFLRPDAIHTSVVVGVAWMDTKLLRATLYSGSTIPGDGPFTHTAPIKADAAADLVAAFNAGFLMKGANGGYYTDHRVVLPLREGAASFVIYDDGRATVAKWGRDATMGPGILAVRQNLDLLVDDGRPVPGLNANDTYAWGATLGNKVYVWRSGVGVTADGALVYVGGPALNITTLAKMLARAGAVRAMELDINPEWVNFVAYRPSEPSEPAAPSNGEKLLSDMQGGTGRYFEPWWSRDFFTMSAAPPPAGPGSPRSRAAGSATGATGGGSTTGAISGGT